MPADQKYISFLDLGRATIELPKTGEKSLFLVWAQTLLRDRPQRPDELQRKGLDLAERYWTYQDVRRGQKLEVLPVQDSKMQQWVSVARLMQTNWDDKTDPTGEIRKAKAELQKARAAYLANAAEDFNAASANFIAALREVGPQLGNYPSAEIIDLEVAYNHWAPFRIAWVCTLLALLGVLLGWASRWRPFYWAALAFYGAGVLAMLVGFGMRMVIAGRAPVTNMYESVVFVGLGTAVLGLVFQLIYRKSLRADGRRGRLHPGADAGRHLPGNPRPQHTSVDAGAAEQLLAGHPRDDHHAQLRRFCPGAVDRQYRARFPSAAFRERGRHRGSEQADVQVSAGGRLAADHRHVPRRELGRLRLGAFLGLGSEGGLGTDHAAWVTWPSCTPAASAGWAISAWPPFPCSASR